MSQSASSSTRREQRTELLLFGFLAFVLAPIIAVIVVTGYGFLVWISQMIMGPPGPPAP